MLSEALGASYANNSSSVRSLLEQKEVDIKTALISPRLTPGSTVILEELIVSQLVTTMHAFYRTRTFIAVLTTDQELSLP
jgi:hypothetical protein